MLSSRVSFQNIAQTRFSGQSEAFDHRIPEHNRPRAGRMQAALDVPSAITIRIVFNAVAAAFVNENSVGSMPHSEYRIDVRPKRIVAEPVAGPAGRPIRQVNNDKRSQFRQDDEDQEVNSDKSQYGTSRSQEGPAFWCARDTRGGFAPYGSMQKMQKLVALFDQKISQDQAIQLAPGKRAESVFRSVHDRFAPQIEGRIENHRNAGGLSESLNQIVIERTVLFKDGLHASGAIHVGDCRQRGVVFRLYRRDVEHITQRVLLS